jgi:uncharacterized protein (UPF0335 family)
MKDESHLPVSEQSLVFRLRKRAEIRRQIQDRKSVQEGRADRIADLLEEAADEIERLKHLNKNLFYELEGVIIDSKQDTGFDQVCLETTVRVKDTLGKNSL